MARTRGTNPNDAELNDAQIELLRAQAALAASQPGQNTAELQAKMQLALQQMQSEQGINASKIGLGREEIAGRNRQTNVAAAVEALANAAKEGIAARAEQGNIASDLAKDTSIPLNIKARTLAESGQPGLYNATQAEETGKRELAINQIVPALRSASSDAEREKKFKPALDALGPDAYPRALALAFPKPENESVRAAPTPKRFEGTVTTPAATPGVDWTGLAKTLIGDTASSAPIPLPTGQYQTPAGIPHIGGSPAIPSNRLVQHGQVFGAPAGMDFNVNTGEFVPTSTVGTINGRPATDVIAEGALKRGVSPEDSRSRVAYNALLNAKNTAGNVAPTTTTGNPAALNLPLTVQQPAPTVPLITQPMYDQLVPQNGQVAAMPQQPSSGFGLSFNDQAIPISVNMAPATPNETPEEIARRQAALGARNLIR